MFLCDTLREHRRARKHCKTFMEFVYRVQCPILMKCIENVSTIQKTIYEFLNTRAWKKPFSYILTIYVRRSKHSTNQIPLMRTIRAKTLASSKYYQDFEIPLIIPHFLWSLQWYNWTNARLYTGYQQRG